MTKTIENGVVVLTADTGMKLTNDTAFGTVVRLGAGDSEANWREVTEAEADRMTAEADADEEITDSEALDIIVNGGKTDA